MSIYQCQGPCEKWRDNDWFPMEELDGKLVCPECAAEMEESPRQQEFNRDQLDLIKLMESQDDSEEE